MAFADHSIAHYGATTQSMRWIQSIGLAVSAVLLIGVGFSIRRSVWSDVGGEPLVAAQVARHVAQGNLSINIPLLMGDQRSIVAALKEMQTRLAAVVGSVRQSADEVATAAMEELVSVVNQNADSSEKANQLALNASKMAIEGGAVVASEVRSLAGRSADAAKEIKALINPSVKQVERGSALVDKAGTTMDEVVRSIRCVTDTMAEINAASHGQFAHVSEAMTQMDQATQKNAAVVEEMAAASSLKSQANELIDMVAIFKLDGEVVQARPKSPAAGAIRVKEAITKTATIATLPRLALASKIRA